MLKYRSLRIKGIAEPEHEVGEETLQTNPQGQKRVACQRLKLQSPNRDLTAVLTVSQNRPKDHRRA
jgi:hypothetical protein